MYLKTFRVYHVPYRMLKISDHINHYVILPLMQLGCLVFRKINVKSQTEQQLKFQAGPQIPRNYSSTVSAWEFFQLKYNSCLSTEC